MELRIARVSYPEIARRLGYTDESGARRAVERELQRTRATSAECAKELRQLDLAKLDETEARLTRIIREDNHVLAIAASRALMVVLARRAALLGLDAPIVVDARADADAKAELERALDKIALAVGRAPIVIAAEIVPSGDGG